MYTQKPEHKSREVKNINLSLSELKYAGADRHDGISKYLLKKEILKFFRTSRPKNLQHLTFEDRKSASMLLLWRNCNGWLRDYGKGRS